MKLAGRVIIIIFLGLVLVSLPLFSSPAEVIGKLKLHYGRNMRISQIHHRVVRGAIFRALLSTLPPNVGDDPEIKKNLKKNLDKY
ncbi:MAG: hypothetical protein J7M18_08750, partial [Candidatus Eremiobacteraeota bacterium]|nr:hypothetical protein [Candidatus Eremiobacteraeota bacterium]